ncbi:hypothetical protein CRG98_013319 [Punica granatum]|uniref:Uncharacterized protein n=1 Tax=Punica granatum TaxID=22663 RepID=A0A2I0KDP3_PUNGR|nr:hypothetical protein CRG98_013319 [Punica granatum]
MSKNDSLRSMFTRVKGSDVVMALPLAFEADLSAMITELGTKQGADDGLRAQRSKSKPIKLVRYVGPLGQDLVTRLNRPKLATKSSLGKNL